jgi:hypothetical protein
MQYNHLCLVVRCSSRVHLLEAGSSGIPSAVQHYVQSGIIAMFQGLTDPLPAGSFGSTRAALHHVGKLTLNLYKRTLLLRLTWTAAAGLT